MIIKFGNGETLTVTEIFDEQFEINVFYVDSYIDKSFFTEEKLSNITIDGQQKGKMYLDILKSNNEQTTFSFRQPSAYELQQQENELLLSKIDYMAIVLDVELEEI